MRERRRRLGQTLGWFLLTLLLALFIPDIGKVISVIGGLAAGFIFIFPGRALLSPQQPGLWPLAAGGGTQHTGSWVCFRVSFPRLPSFARAGRRRGGRGRA